MSTISQEQLSKILSLVEKPGRYIGREANSVYKKLDQVRVHCCLVFPDVYELGMSNTGLRILYQLVNAYTDCYAERSFCPWPDMRQKMREAGIPLYSMETHTPLAEFDFLGFSLQTEMCYTNIPYLLELAGIPVMAAERNEDMPLVCAGGPNMANPEPVADFFDFFVIGDGEAVLPALLNIFRERKEKQLSRKEILLALHRIAGIYVPSLHPTIINSSGEVIPQAALPEFQKNRVKRVWVNQLTNQYYLGDTVVPNLQPIHLRLGIEVMRGCTQGCRFCQAGYWYRPAREMEPSQVLEAMKKGVQSTGLNDFGLLSLSTADYSKLNELVKMTKAEFVKTMHVNVSLPSLRADRFTAQLAVEMEDMHKGGLTFAPETGSERLRRFINKNISNKQMFEAAEVAYKNGWENIKLYIMIGIPSEVWEDIQSIVWLTKEILKIGKKISPRKSVSLNIGILSPKSFTPLQWDACDQPAFLSEKIKFLKRELSSCAKLSFHDIENSIIESVLARGDRRLSQVIYQAYQDGACFDSWYEHFRFEVWLAAFEKKGINYLNYQRKRSYQEPLPWDVIDMGIRKAFLKAERINADQLITKPDCKWGHCNFCGIPGNYQDISLAKEEEFVASSADPKLVNIPQAPAILDKPIHYRLRYRKEGDARFLGHRDCMSLFEQALRRTGLRFKYSEGFHPKMKMTAGPALPLGYESDVEYLEVFLLEKGQDHWFRVINDFLPKGFSIVEAGEVRPGDFTLSKFKSVNIYRIEMPEAVFKAHDVGQLLADYCLRTTVVANIEGEKRAWSFDFKEWVKDIRWHERDPYLLEVELIYIHNEKSASLNHFLGRVLNFTKNEINDCLVRKTQMVIQETVSEKPVILLPTI